MGARKRHTRARAGPLGVTTLKLHKVHPFASRSHIWLFFLCVSPSGSFGVKEDDFFELASQYARAHRLPRVYISCNSGARIGLVDSLKPLFKVGASGSRAA